MIFHKMQSELAIIVCFLILLSGCVSRTPTTISDSDSGRQTDIPERTGSTDSYVVFGETYYIMPDSKGYVEIGVASWYGKKFHGRKTSNGETYNMYALTAAHKSLPLPTYVKVTNLDNRRNIVLKVNDRGPFHDDRLIDLSFKAAQELGFSDKGIAAVVVESIDYLNYPDTVPLPVGIPASSNHYYLQLGAFIGRESAEALVRNIEQLMNDNAYSRINVKILESEQETNILHKVWMGPLSSEQEREQLVVLVEDAQLGKPIRIEVE